MQLNKYKLKILRLIEYFLQRIKEYGVRFETNHRWVDWDDSFIFDTPSGEYKGTGQHVGGWGRGTSELQKSINKKFTAKPGAQISYLPGGLFYVDVRKKQAMRMVTGTYSINDKFIESRPKNVIDFSNWRRWDPYNKLEQK